MKSVAIIWLMVSFTVPAEWLNNFDTAKQIAKDKKQFILLNFSGSDWCAPCIMMKKEIFSTEVFNSYAGEHLVLVQADFPRLKKNRLSSEQVKRNEALADRYNPRGKFPYTILLDSEGSVIASWEGYQSTTPEKFIQRIKQQIEPAHVGSVQSK